MDEDKEHIKNLKFRDDTLLKARKVFYRLSKPFVDLDKEIISRISTEGSLKILDVGCGNGDLLIKLRNTGFSGEMKGIDFSEGIINNARDAGKGTGIDFRIGEAEHLPFRDDFFDIIIAKHVLHLVGRPQQAFNEIWRCLKKGGKFICVLHTARNKPFIHALEKEINEKFKVSIMHTSKNVTMEDADQYFEAFKVLEKKSFESKVELKEAKPFVDYFETLKYSWVPKLTEEQWKLIVETVRRFVEQMIKDQGHFIELNSNGLIVAKK
ncbi:methyltransferase domain-containing protein [Candidatus Woesearchaeota archaeon]|nr:methyltransferase domain-containing protein [Candidatus Woesearchaeota archaeon]